MVLRVESQNCIRPSTRGQIDLTLPSVAKALSARTKESRRGRREAGCNGRCPRRVTAAALAPFCTVLKLILAETRAQGRGLERTPPINDRSVNGGAGRTDRRNWAKRQGRGVDDDVLIVRIREHYLRDKCLATEVVREECTPGLLPCSRAAAQIARDGAFRTGNCKLKQFAVDPRSAPECRAFLGRRRGGKMLNWHRVLIAA